MNGRSAAQQPDLRRGIVRWLIGAAVYILILALSLFLAAGRLDWGAAWVYLGLYTASQALTALVLVPRNPALLAERADMSVDQRDLDRVLAGIIFLWGPLMMWIVAGLDARNGWSADITRPVQLIALVIAALGALLTIWAMAANRFFYGLVRIRADRGHTLATAGPYRYVRHPGYVGGILFDLATPLILGSLWALVPAALTVCVFVARTALEDRTLQAALDGYREYAGRVRYRLLPGVW